MNIIDAVAKVLAGAVVGYATNDLAIKMLFQEYLKISRQGKTMFSLGGVIVKERESFQTSISRLVEQEVIHPQSLAPEIEKAEFEQVLTEIFTQLITRHLPETLPTQIKVGQLPGVSQSFAQVKAQLVAELAAPLQIFLPQLIASGTATQVISPAQTEAVADKLTEWLVEHLHTTHALHPLAHTLVAHLLTLSPTQLLGEHLLAALRQALPQILHELHHVLAFTYQLPIDTLIEQTLANLDFKSLLQSIAQALSQRSLLDFFPDSTAEALPTQLTAQLHQLFTSDASEGIIEILLKQVFQALAEEPSTIFELLSEDLKQGFEHFLHQQLPEILEILIPWVREKSEDLGKLVQDAFEDNTSLLGQIIVAVFLGNIGEYIGIEERVVNIIDEHKQAPQKIARQATDWLTNYLQTHTIGQIFKQFAIEKSITKIAPTLRHTITDALAGFKLANIEWLDKPLNTWLPTQELTKILLELLDNVLDTQLRDKWLYTPAFTQFVQDQLERSLDKFAQKPIASWLAPEQSTQHARGLEKMLLELFLQQKQNLKKAIADSLKDFIPNQLPTQLTQASSVNTMAQMLGEALDKFLGIEIHKIADTPLQDYAARLANTPQLGKQAAETLQRQILEHLPSIMRGRIEQLVKENLAKQPDTQLRNMVYKAMGEELAPLSWFGAFLGAITGFILLGVTFDYTHALYTALLISGLAYGITGWGTNWLAIKMLFRPHEVVMIPVIRRRLPFTPGVVAKNRVRFANSMGRFLGDRLLNKENLQASFEKNKEAIITGLTNLLSRDDFKLVKDLVEKNKATLGQALSRAVLNSLHRNEPRLRAGLRLWLRQNRHSTLNSLPLEKIQTTLQDTIHTPEFGEAAVGLLEQRLQHAAQSPQTLKEVLPEQILKGLPARIARILKRELQGLEASLTVEQIFALLNWTMLEQKLGSTLQRNLDELLNPEQENRLKDRIFVFLRDRVQSESVRSRIAHFVREKLDATLDPNKQIKEILNGKLLEWLHHNLPNILRRILNGGITWLQSRREELAERIYQDTLKQSPLAWTYENSIRKTTYDLIDHRIPEFFEREFDSLKVIIARKIRDLGEIPLSKVPLRVLDSQSVDTRLHTILNNPQLLRKTRQVTDLILETRIFKIPLQSLLIAQAPELLAHLRVVLRPEAEHIAAHLRQGLQDDAKISKLTDTAAEILYSLIHRQALSLRISEIFKSQEASTWHALAQHCREIIVRSATGAVFTTQTLPTLIAALAKAPLEDIIDTRRLNDDLQATLSDWLQNPAKQLLLQTLLAGWLGNTLSTLPAQLRTETKQFVVMIATQAINHTLKNHIAELIAAINFKGVVVREISAMHPRELENLFYGFASKYFTFLIGYGFIFGILFGWVIDLGILGAAMALLR